MQNNYELIEKYLLGELSPAELENFEKSLASDLVFAKEVAKHREMMQRLEALRLRNKVKSAIVEETNIKKSVFLNPRIWAIASSLALLLLSIWYFKQSDYSTPVIVDQKVENPTPSDSIPIKKTTEIVDIHSNGSKHTEVKTNISVPLFTLISSFVIMPTEVLLREATENNTNPESSLLVLALKAFNKKDYLLTLDHLNKMNINPMDEEAILLRAHAYFQIRKYENASRDFDQLKNSFQYMHEARWNFLLCEVALGKIENQNNLLNEMIKDKDFPFRGKAIELQKKLKPSKGE